MTFNATKSVAILFSHKHSATYEPDIDPDRGKFLHLGDPSNPIPWETEVKYLSILLDPKKIVVHTTCNDKSRSSKKIPIQIYPNWRQNLRA